MRCPGGKRGFASILGAARVSHGVMFASGLLTGSGGRSSHRHPHRYRAVGVIGPSLLTYLLIYLIDIGR